ncbi:unnamed protein product [Sympodiomycopsis kandeliae]
MTFVDGIAALSEGSLPSNTQLITWISHLESQIQSQPDEKNGHLLRQDLVEILHLLQGLILERNTGQEVQEIIWNARGAALKLGEEVTKEEVERRKAEKKASRHKSENTSKASNPDVTKEGLKESSQKAWSHVLTLVRTVLIQPELRHLLADVLVLITEVGDETFTQLFSQETRTSMGQRVEDVDKARGTIVGVIDEIKRNQGVTAQGMDVLPTLDEVRLFISKEIKSNDALITPGQGGHLHSRSTDLADALQLLSVDGLLSKSETFHSAIRQTPRLANTAQSLATDNAKRIWKDQGRQRVLIRSKRLLVDVQSRPSSQDGLLWFLTRLEDAVKYVAGLSDRVDIYDPHKDPSNELAVNVIALCENFLGQGVVEEILTLAHRLSTGYHQNDTLRELVKDAGKYLHLCVEKEGWVLEQECSQDYHNLVGRFHRLGKEYQADVKRLTALVSGSIQRVQQDELLLSLLSAVQRLGSDVTLGKSFLYFPSKATLHEILHGLLPPLFASSVLPIPRVKYTHPDFVLVLENIAISLRDLLPDTIDFRLTHDFHIDLQRLKRKKIVKNGKTLTHYHSFKIKIKGLGLRVHKVAFAVDLLKGIKFHDKGILDLQISDVGCSIYIDVPVDAGTKSTNANCFIVRKVKSKLGKLSVKVRQSNHFILHKLAEGLVDSGVTKFILRQLMSKGIRLGLEQLNLLLVQFKLNNWIFTSNTDPKRSQREQLILLRTQAVQLRDEIRKLRENLGSLEVDFVDPTSGKSALETWRQQNLGMWNWIRKQFVSTAAEEGGRKTERGQKWKSNVFDRKTSSEVHTKVVNGDAKPGQDATKGEKILNGHAHAKKDAEETPREAALRSKPQGPTTEATVEDADRQRKKQKKKYWPWFGNKKEKVE